MTQPRCMTRLRRCWQQGLSQVNGVGQVSVGGASLPAVRVDVNPTQLNSYGLGLPAIANMLRSQNANLPKGQIANDQMTADILANDQLLKAEQYKPLIVGLSQRRSDQVVRCGERYGFGGEHPRGGLRQRRTQRLCHRLPPAWREHH